MIKYKIYLLKYIYIFIKYEYFIYYIHRIYIKCRKAIKKFLSPKRTNKIAILFFSKY